MKASSLTHFKRRLTLFRTGFLSVMLSMSLMACSSDNEPTTEPDNPEYPSAGTDYSGLHSFIASSTAANDYCKSIIITDGNKFLLKTIGGNTISVDKGGTPYILLNSDGSLLAEGNELSGKNAPALTLSSVPSAAKTADGYLTIDDRELPVKAGDGLLCVVNTRKYIHFCFAEGTESLPSDMLGYYNPPLPEHPDHLNILFIGNSFTQDATEHLPAMLTASGITGVDMTRLYHGGYTLPEYNTNFNKNNICAERTATAGSTQWSSNETLDDCPATAIARKVWDVVVIQEHTGRAEGWDYPGTLAPAVIGLLDKIYKLQPDHRPTVIYLLAQTYSTGSSVLASYFNNNRTTMFKTITSTARNLMADTGIDMVISSAAMIENLRTSSLMGENSLQLTRDTYHLDYGISRYAAACAVFETIITPTLGNRVADCPYRYDVSNTESGKYTTPVTDANAPVAQEAAHQAVEHPFAITPVKL